MSATELNHPPERVELVRLTARLGAVTAGALADHDDVSVATARARLGVAERLGLLRGTRMLRDQPTLFTATRAGARLAGLDGIEPTRLSPASAGHAVACAEVAVVLARAYPGFVLSGERELLRDEGAYGAPLASPRLHGGPRRGHLHRPDLVMWPSGSTEDLPIAVEVELSTKAPARLLQICVAWARCRSVSGVLYVSAASVHQALSRAIAAADAAERIVLVDLDTMLASRPGSQPQPVRAPAPAPESPIAGRA